MRKIVLVILLFVFVGCSGDDKATNLPTSEDKPGKITVMNENGRRADNASPFIGYNITGENLVKFSPDGEETPLTKEIGAHVVIRNKPYESIHKSLIMKRLSKNFIVKCSACHDDYGNGVIGPTLLTKNADEIFDMIIKYKTNKESNILMKELVLKMDEKEIRFLAEDISKFNEEMRKENGK